VDSGPSGSSDRSLRETVLVLRWTGRRIMWIATVSSYWTTATRLSSRISARPRCETVKMEQNLEAGYSPSEPFPHTVSYCLGASLIGFRGWDPVPRIAVDDGVLNQKEGENSCPSGRSPSSHCSRSWSHASAVSGSQYQVRSRFFCPFEDEIGEPEDPLSIVLKYLDSDLRTESDRHRLTRPEIKQVAKYVLEALRTPHYDGMVHTGIPISQGGRMKTC